MRTRRRGYLRNIAVALGNSKNTEAIPALNDALLIDDEPLVRAHAAWALGKIGGPSSKTSLEQARSQETDPSVLAEIDSALKNLLV